LAGRPLDAWLNAGHGVDSHTYQQLKRTCMTGVAEGGLDLAAGFDFAREQGGAACVP
jgi:hypothetical protein